MALSYKARRRWSLIILLVGLPLYILIASVLVTWLNPTNFLLELLIYVGLGVFWILPFKPVFRGIGQADPDADPDNKKRGEQ